MGIKNTLFFMCVAFLFISCAPKSMLIEGDLVTVAVVDIAENDGGLTATLKAGASVPSAKETDFAAEIEGGYHNKGNVKTVHIKLPTFIVEKAFNEPENYKIKIHRDGTVEIESRSRTVQPNLEENNVNIEQEEQEIDSTLNKGKPEKEYFSGLWAICKKPQFRYAPGV